MLALVLLAGTAVAKPAWRPRPPTPTTDALDLAARLVEAIRTRSATNVQALLADPLVYEGLWFADAACAKRFGNKGTLEKADVRVLAKCLAQAKPITTTRRSSASGGAILTIDPGVELEVVFSGDRMHRIHGLWPHDADRGTPVLTVQAFEALRTAGTTQLDAVLKDKLAPASAWIKLCLDKTGAISSTTVLEAKPPAAADVFLAAIADWKFRAFELRKTPTPVCSLSLLTYPAANAPPVEVIPPAPMVASIAPVLIDELKNPFDFDGVYISGASAPQNVAPSQLEKLRIKGASQIPPDASTKRAMAAAKKDRAIASFKLCIDDRGAVSSVSLLKSSGFRDYDTKLEREMRRWAYKPFLVNGTAAPVCTAVTFIAKP